MTHLRFPLPPGYFPKFELHPDETLAYKELVTDIVKETRREYDRYVRDAQRQVDPRRWKQHKSKDRLHIYRRRSEYGGEKVGLYGSSAHGSSGVQANGSSIGSSMDYGLRSESESSSYSIGAPPSSTSSTREASYATAMTAQFTSPATFLLASSITNKEKKKERLNSENSGRGSSSMSLGSSRSSGMPDHELSALDEGTPMGVHKRALEPLMLAVGVLDGTVDDLVYALHEGSANEMRQMASFMGDDSLIDCAVLHTIKQSKTTHLGIKWKLMRTPGGNRDMCFLEYVGVANDSKGTRYGFRVVESIQIPQCPAFQDNSIIRTELSFCYLFRETSTPGLVDVYMEGNFDSSSDAVTAGGVGDARSTVDMLLSIETCMERAEAKKLAELVAKQASAPPRTNQSGSHCSICRARPGLLSSHLFCQGCGAVICTKCRMKKTIIHAKKGTKQKISCCKICLVNVKDKSPFEGEPINDQRLKRLQKREQSQNQAEPSQALVVPARTQEQYHHHHQQQQQQAALQHQLSHLAITDGPTKLDRQRTAGSLADTEYSASMQSWQSSSVSSSYSDLDDTSAYGGSYSPNTLESHALVMSEPRHKMPAVMEHGAGAGGGGRHLPQYAHTDMPPHMAMHHHQLPPPPPASTAAPPSAHANQHRMGLYNQMLELQMQAERAYNLANQNAAYMQQRQ